MGRKIREGNEIERREKMDETRMKREKEK